MHSTVKKAASMTLAAALAAAGLVVMAPTQQAQAAPSTDLVISEAYGGGGNSGAVYSRDFVELYNMSDAPVSLDGLTLEYYSASGNSGGRADLSGEVPAQSHYLVAAAAGNNTDLPSFAFDAEAGFNMSGTNGSVALLDGADTVDLVGWGPTVALFEGAPAESTSNSTSVARVDVTVDTDDNGADFAVGAPTPQGLADDGENPDPDPEPDPEPQELAISEIQGTGDATPYAGQPVITEGVVTAVYTGQGSKNGFNIQEPGAVDLDTHDASIGIFVYGSSLAASVEIGDSVEVSGTATEYNEVTQINGDAVQQLEAPLGTAEAVELPAWPTTDEERERFEGMLLAPQGTYTVSDNYSLNSFGEIGLAFGDEPLVQPTEVGAPGSPEAIARAEQNAITSVLLDDGQTWNLMTNPDATSTPLPYLTLDSPVTIGATVEFTGGVVLDYGFGAWRFQPTHAQQGVEGSPVTFSDVREAAPAEVGGDISIATFNVLNYFTTLGDTEADCAAYTDREGNPIVTDYCGPRGAYNQENLDRQEAKIVAAINQLDASVVALEEIEDSSDFGQDRDAALAWLVDRLNAAAGEERWAFVPAPAELPQIGDDVIRTAFIYQSAEVAYVDGTAEELDHEDFINARAPFAALFAPVDPAIADNEFLVIVNHLKSKGGSGDGDNENRDSELGPAYAVGGWNGDRVRQATALADFAADLEARHGTDLSFLTGDFNSYAQEDPMAALYDAGYVNLTSGGPEYSYAYGGMVGSLDHVLASPEAAALITGTDIWTINAYEPVALEYSRHNYNVTQLYAPDAYRSSDHNPGIVGVAFERDAVEEPTLTLSDDEVTETESADGIGYFGAGFADGTVVVELVDADGEVTVIDPAAAVTDGAFEGLLVYETSDGERLQMPVGTYTLRAVDADTGEVLAEAVFEVDAGAPSPTPGEPSPEPTPEPTPGDGGFGGEDLPRTGGEPALALLVMALLLTAGGAGFMVWRRRTA